MQIEVSAETGRRIEELLAGGRFQSADELIVQGLNLIEEERAFSADIAPLVADGVQAMREGRTREVTPNLADEIIAAGIQRSSARLGRTG
jgi:Arc/MetJ-type ribon-helix-helix transcriptional regulator